MTLQPTVGALHMRRNFRKVVVSDEAHELKQALGQVVACYQLAFGACHRLVHEDFGHVHSLDPAEHIGSADLHQTQRNRIPGEVSVHRADQAVVGNGCVAAQDKRMFSQMSFHEQQELSVAFLDLAFGLGIDPEHFGRLSHAATGV